jgi:hypothetical protein
MNKKLFIGIIFFESLLSATFLVYAFYQKAVADRQREAAHVAVQHAEQLRAEYDHIQVRLDDCLRSK